ncbi:MAG: helix-turn-helix domain-containing protein [Ruminococcaceae bacterium]|nr:helix-turn-helix domain-containing protein [Oscillospiraceae bacterium]
MRNKEPPYVYDRSRLPEILTVAEMATFMRASEQTVRNRIKEGKLAAIVDDKVIRIKRKDALRYLGLEESA